MNTIVSIPLPREYGYVMGTATVSAFVMTYLGMKVAGARKRANVAYPQMYAEVAETTQNKEKYVFNCYQRAHQNALETYPQFLTLLAFGGLKHPLVTSGLGLLWCVARIHFAWGYWTGNPDKRRQGSYHYLALLGLVGTTTSTALSLLGYI